MPTKIVNHITIDYKVIGKGSVILLLHGLGSTKKDWEYQEEYFAKNYKLVIPDMRGHGDSEITSEYGVEHMAKDMKALLDALEIQQCHVIGFSMGGAVAFQMAYDYPNAIQKIVIVNSGPDFNKMDELGLDLLKTRTAFIQTRGLKELAKQIAYNMFPEDDQKQWRDEFEERCAANNEEAYLQSFTTLMHWGMGDKLLDIKQEALIVGSDMDYTPVHVKEEYTQRMLNAKLEVIKNSRHGVVMDQADEFNRIVDNFLKE